LTEIFTSINIGNKKRDFWFFVYHVFKAVLIEKKIADFTILCFLMICLNILFKTFGFNKKNWKIGITVLTVPIQKFLTSFLLLLFWCWTTKLFGKILTKFMRLFRQFHINILFKLSLLCFTTFYGLFKRLNKFFIK
jgi:hypothetical protein